MKSFCPVSDCSYPLGECTGECMTHRVNGQRKEMRKHTLEDDYRPVKKMNNQHQRNHKDYDGK